jgi:iron complex transport system permease protein
VGLTTPHIARAIVGPDQRWVLPCSALLGPVLLVGADVIGRIVARPGELEVGIVTAIIGAPVFIALVRRRRIAQL